MAVSEALEKSAKNFCHKYACDFDFDVFESRVEEFTFLRPNNGWIDLYRLTFDALYERSLEKAATGDLVALDGEAMLDDFEYTLIRPYVKESTNEIRHKPYIGMDRMSRLSYLDRLTVQAPKNPVELSAERYKRGELTLKEMRSAVLSGNDCGHVEIAGYAQALENVNASRTAVWRTLHPFKNSAEKKNAEQMKAFLIEQVKGDEGDYAEIVEEAHKTFDGHQRVHARLAERTVHAREEETRLQKMTDARRESLRIEGFEPEPVRERSPRVEERTAPVREIKGLE